MQYRQKTPNELQCIGHPETAYIFAVVAHGAPKTAENRDKNCQKYAV